MPRVRDPAGALSEAQATSSQPAQPKGNLPTHLPSQRRAQVREQSCWGPDGMAGRPRGSTSQDLQLRKNSLPCLHGRKEPSSLSPLLARLKGRLLVQGLVPGLVSYCSPGILTFGWQLTPGHSYPSQQELEIALVFPPLSSVCSSSTWFISEPFILPRVQGSTTKWVGRPVLAPSAACVGIL